MTVAARPTRPYLGGPDRPESSPCPSGSPQTLPADDVPRRKGVAGDVRGGAQRQDIRPLRIGLLNLMPKKVQTETQFARLIGATPLQIDLTSRYVRA